MPDNSLPPPSGRAAEAWARLSITAMERRRLLPILRAAVDAMPDEARSRMLLATDALFADLDALLTLGCPVPGGHDPMAIPAAILEARRG